MADKEPVDRTRALFLLLMAPFLVLPGAASVHLCLCAWLGCTGVDIAGPESFGQDCCKQPVVAELEAPACPFCEVATAPTEYPQDGPNDGATFQNDCGNCRDLIVEGLEPFEEPLSQLDPWVPTTWVSLQPEAERRWERCRHRLPACRPPPRAVERGRGLPLRI
ncbi:MAG: hypothetical protein ACYS26_01450 [Planctomycetota bacterium]|jgi:hypothetical protein